MTKREQFNKHAAAYEHAMRGNSVGDDTRHPAHKAIVAMGEQALPFIAKRMRANSGHWFSAARMITGHDPIKEWNSGFVESMRRDWLEYLEDRA